MVIKAYEHGLIATFGICQLGVIVLSIVLCWQQCLVVKESIDKIQFTQDPLEAKWQEIRNVQDLLHDPQIFVSQC